MQMSIFSQESLSPLVCAVEKATGHRPHLSTVIRWCIRGSSGIRLESKVLGGRRLTSPEAVRRFMDSVTAAKDRTVPTPLLTIRQESTAATRAAQKLAALVGTSVPHSCEQEAD
jgi:hypothetical protein